MSVLGEILARLLEWQLEDHCCLSSHTVAALVRNAMQKSDPVVMHPHRGHYASIMRMTEYSEIIVCDSH
jgi:hypothetical protein